MFIANFVNAPQRFVVIMLMASFYAIAGTAFAQTAPIVSVIKVPLEEVLPGDEFVGRVEALNTLDIRTRVEGFIDARSFDEGQMVSQGQDLFTIEKTTYEIALKDAQATLASAQATLADAERQLQRNQALRQAQTTSQATLEQSQTARDTAKAAVTSAEAKVSQAELNLEYTRIKSPISGRIGRANFAVGSLVSPSSDPLARVVQMDPIRVVFSVSDRTILDVRQAAGGLSKEQLAKRFVPTLRLSNGQQYDAAGEIEFFGNEVDPLTGTIPIRALFSNPQALLIPGQFVTVIVREIEAKRHPVVPLGAVEQDREGRFVLLVDKDSRATIRRIQVSTQAGQNWVVDQGLDGGETLIVGGLHNVSPGTVVQAVEVAGPAPELTGEVGVAQPSGASSGPAQP